MKMRMMENVMGVIFILKMTALNGCVVIHVIIGTVLNVLD